jgi:hypothetical protein
VSINDGYLGVVVETSKNHPEGFRFRVLVDRERPNCVRVFMLDYMILMEIRVGDPGSFFACKLTSAGGILRAVPSKRVSDSTMRALCKTLIAATGLDPFKYATHSSKRGGTLMALQAGLSTAQIQEPGRWSSAPMVSRSLGQLASSTVRGSSFASFALSFASFASGVLFMFVRIGSSFSVAGWVAMFCGPSPFLPSADSKAVCRRLRNHFLTPPTLPLPSPPLPPDIIESQL